MKKDKEEPIAKSIFDSQEEYLAFCKMSNMEKKVFLAKRKDRMIF